MSLNNPRIGIIGSGAWGTALAIHLARQHSHVFLWGRNANTMADMAAHRENKRYLPGIIFPHTLQICTDFTTEVQDSDFLLIAVLSTAFRDILRQLKPHLSSLFRGVIGVVKGFELESGKFLHLLVQEELSREVSYAVLSGPSFANEVARGLPTAVTVAGTDEEFTHDVATLFHHDAFRAYTSTDIVGVELGGAFKNVLAIAAGIIDGLKFGANARAALITRGLAEMMRFGAQLGADPKTLAGLSGVGDTVLSCTDNQSRNRRLGLMLAEGKSVADIEREIGQVLEGQYAAQAIYQLSRKMNIEMPICEQVYNVLTGKDPLNAVQDLLARSLKNELD